MLTDIAKSVPEKTRAEANKTAIVCKATKIVKVELSPRNHQILGMLAGFHQVSNAEMARRLMRRGLRKQAKLLNFPQRA